MGSTLAGLNLQDYLWECPTNHVNSPSLNDPGLVIASDVVIIPHFHPALVGNTSFQSTKVPAGHTGPEI